MRSRKKRYGPVNFRQVILWSTAYQFFAGLWMTKGYVKKVRESLYELCPLEEQQIRKSALRVCIATWGIACIVFYGLFIRSPGVYSLCLAVFYSIVLTKETLRLAMGKLERKVLRQTEKMLNDVRHFYYDTRSITGALQEAAGCAGVEMRMHIERLIDVLGASCVDEAVEEYNRTSTNRFLKLFLSQCVAIQEYGDTELDGESLFVRNLSDLREDILNYLLQLDRLQMEFTGLTFITLVPLLVLPVIKTTAIGTLPELRTFYDGVLGVILPVIYLVGTVMVYSVIVEMQELDAKKNTYQWLRKVEKNRIVSAALDCWEKKHYRKTVLQKRSLRRAGEQLTPRLLFMEKVLYFLMAVLMGISVLLWAKKTQMPVQFYEIAIILLSGLFAFCVPDMRLTYRKSLMQMNMLSEVTQFQSIIMMQMFIPDITVLRILTTMEQFAHIFRTSIQNCINEYSYSVQGALEGMKNSESYEMFRRLCDNLLTVDKIGIVRSFEEIVQDRIHFQKQREADTYRIIKKKAAYARLIAFIPMILIMVSYLILPYGVEAVRQFSMILEELNRL